MKNKLLLFTLMFLPMMASADDNGSCGESVTYYYDENTHTLSISGEGQMTNFSKNKSPWNAYSKDITSLIINEGVTFIGSYAFYECSNITSLNIANSVAGIGSYAFGYCSGLTSLILGPNITGIGSDAFAVCSGLNKITIKCSPEPDAYDSVFSGSSIFGYCENINEVIFDCEIVRRWHFGTSIYDVAMTDKVTTIGRKAFEGYDKIKSITIGKNVELIDDYAFKNCIGFTSLTILGCPKTVKSSIWCPELKEVIFDCEETPCIIGDAPAVEVVTLSDKVKKIGDSSLSGFKFKTINIPNSVTDIGTRAFWCCTELNNIELPTDLKSIGYAAFEGCTGLSSILLPSSINTLGEDAFKDCTGLNSIIISNGISTLCGFSGCTGLTNIEIPSSVTTIGESAFSGCSAFTSFTIPSSVTTIGNSAFNNCAGLTAITIPSNITILGYSAFNGCTSLKEVTIEDSDVPLEHGTYCFKDCPIEDLNIGRDLYVPEDIINKASDKTIFELFKGIQTLTTLRLGKNVTRINNGFFEECSNLMNVYFSEGLQDIQGNAFYNCSNLESVVLPSSLSTIGYRAFSGCNKIKKVTIPPNVNQISDDAFSSSSLDTVVIEDSDNRLECGGSFYGSLNNVYIGRPFSSNFKSLIGSNNSFNLTIGKKVKGIGAESFKNLVGIKKLIIEESTDTLSFGQYSNYFRQVISPFSGTPIDSVYLGRYIKGQYADPFGVSKPFHLTVGNSISEIGDMAFADWDISSVIIPNSVKKIGWDAFNSCYTLNSVTIEDGPTSLEFLDGSNFSSCQLESLYLGRDLSYDTDNSPFKYNKEALSSLTIGDQVTEIGENLFVGLKSVERIEFPKSLKRIGKQAFYGCEALTSISIPNSVIEIGQDAFDLTRSLSSFIIEDGEEILSINNSFLNSPLSEVYIGRNITYPEGYSPFNLLESLKKVTIGCQVTNLGKAQYAGCQNLKDVVTYAVDVPETGQNVFTESYLADATLHVLDVAYKNYRVKYPWNRFKNYMLIDENGDETPAPSITINEGDASGDGVVNAADIVEIVSYMMGFPSDKFIFNNADINGDGVVNSADIVQIVNIIMGK